MALIDDHDLDPLAARNGEDPRRGRSKGPKPAGSRGPNIPDVVIRRLPIYARTLQYLLADGVEHVSSEDLGDRIDVSAAQIRRDLAYFGDFGKQGKGYQVEFLLGQIKGILQLQQSWNVALVGVGDLGRALIRYDEFRQNGFHITALFDHNPQKYGQHIGDLVVQPVEAMSGILLAQGISIALLAVPAAAAQEVADQLVANGVQAILNYAPTVVKVPRHVCIRHIDPVVALQSMTYYLPAPEDE